MILLFLLSHFCHMQVCHDIRLTHINKKVVLQRHRADRLREDTIANAQVLDIEVVTFIPVPDLELSTSMLLFVLLLAYWYNEVVDDLLLEFGVGTFRWAASCTIQMFGQRFLAAEVSDAVEGFSEWLRIC